MAVCDNFSRLFVFIEFIITYMSVLPLFILEFYNFFKEIKRQDEFSKVKLTPRSVKGNGLLLLD